MPLQFDEVERRGRAAARVSSRNNSSESVPMEDMIPTPTHSRTQSLAAIDFGISSAVGGEKDQLGHNAASGERDGSRRRSFTTQPPDAENFIPKRSEAVSAPSSGHRTDSLPKRQWPTFEAEVGSSSRPYTPIAHAFPPQEPNVDDRSVNPLGIHMTRQNSHFPLLSSDAADRQIDRRPHALPSPDLSRSSQGDNSSADESESWHDDGDHQQRKMARRWRNMAKDDVSLNDSHKGSVQVNLTSLVRRFTSRRKAATRTPSNKLDELEDPDSDKIELTARIKYDNAKQGFGSENDGAGKANLKRSDIRRASTNSALPSGHIPITTPGHKTSLSVGMLALGQSLGRSRTIRKASDVVKTMSERVVNVGSAKSPRSDAEMNAMNSPQSMVASPLPPEGNYKQQALRGKSLGYFGPRHPLRIRLRNILHHPYTEPFILLLIILQIILVTIESSRQEYFFQSWINYALLVIFSIFTIEISARIIVSGLVRNSMDQEEEDDSQDKHISPPPHYQSQWASKSPQNQESSAEEKQKSGRLETPALDDIPTINILNVDDYPRDMRNVHEACVQQDKSKEMDIGHLNEPAGSTRAMPFDTLIMRQKGMSTKDAYLRHTWNRLDCVAVISFWIAVVLSSTGIDYKTHLYLFQALALVRSFRLLSITKGTSTILQSLKKAGPLLLNVAIFILFAVVLFSVVGVQSFKGSFRRHCVWPYDDFILDDQSCGGQIDMTTNLTTGYYAVDRNGVRTIMGSGKGYICARGQQCVETGNPFNGTVGWDNIFAAAELVVVISSVNTWTDLMYRAMDSDLFYAALYFIVTVIILNFWLVNLFIAVVINMFHQIRRESRRSAFSNEIIEEVSQPVQRTRLARLPGHLHNFNLKTRLVWVIVVLADLVVQALQTAEDSSARQDLLFQAETIFTVLFAGEIIMRFLGYLPNWRSFFRSKNNIVDSALVLVTVIIQIPPIPDSQAYAWLTAFQVARFYRVILAIPRMKSLLQRVVGTFSGLANMTLFLFMLNYIAALIAVQLFRGAIPSENEDDNPINITFAMFWNGFIGMYQILSSENWTTILYNVSGYEVEYHQHVVGIVYLLAWFSASYFLVLQMFVAVINENFNIQDEKQRKASASPDRMLQRADSQSSHHLSLVVSRWTQLCSYFRLQRFLDPSKVSLEKRASLSFDHAGTEENVVSEKEVTTSAVDRVRDLLGLNELSMEPASVRDLLQRGPLGAGETSDYRVRRLDEDFAAYAIRQRKTAYIVSHPWYDRSCFFFTNANPLRCMCQKLVLPANGERYFGQSPHRLASLLFRGLIFVAVTTSIIVAGVANPVYRKMHYEQIDSFWLWFNIVEVVCGCVYITEFFIKVLADGFIYAPNAYLLDLGNSIDFVVLITLLINLIWSIVDYGHTPRIVRALTAFRALRLINLSRRMRNTFYLVLVAGMSHILDAIVLSVLLIIPFAVLAQNLFSGLLFFCTDDNVTGLAQCIGEFGSQIYNWEVWVPRSWINPYVWSFDNFGSSFLILFEIMSMEGWIDVMFSAISITGPDTQPSPQSAQQNAIFFIIWNIFGTVLILTVFISIVIENFERESGSLKLTNEQRTWQDLKKLLLQQKPSKRPLIKPQGRVQGWMYQYATRKTGVWSHIETAGLILHILLLMSEWYGSPPWVDVTRDWLFLVLTCFFAFNVGIRFFGLGWTAFRRNGWNIYDLVVVGGAIGTLVPLTADSGSSAIVQLNKLFLVAIALKMLQKHDGLDQLMKTAAGSLPAILSIFALWIIWFFVFTIAMMECFGLTKFGTQSSSNLNFRSFGNTFILLARMSTGEGWNTIMHDYAIEFPSCIDSDRYLDSDCGSKVWAYGLFIAWNILSQYIFVNMFTGVVVQNFSFVFQIAGQASVISRKEMRRLKQAWSNYDLQGHGYIKKEHILPFLASLEGNFNTKIYPGAASIPELLRKASSPAVSPAVESRFYFGEYTGASDFELNWHQITRRLQRISFLEARRRKDNLNQIYHECLLAVVPGRGLPFRAMLLILALVLLVDDERSLEPKDLEKRLKTKALVDEQISLERIRGLLKMMFWRRAFLSQQQAAAAARLSLSPKIAASDGVSSLPSSGLQLPTGNRALNAEYVRNPLETRERPKLHLEVANSPFPAHTRSPSAEYRFVRSPTRADGLDTLSPTSADRRLGAWEDLAIRQDERSQMQTMARSETPSEAKRI